MKEKIKIGSFQGPLYENDVKRNIKKFKQVVSETKDKNFDFLCFPETFLTGYSPEAICEGAITADSFYIKDILEYTKDTDTVYLVGFAEKRNDGIYNSQIVFHLGKIIDICTKTMLTRGYDDKYFITDLHMPVMEAKGIKFAVTICHSTSFPEPALYLRLKGARLLFTPHFNNIHPHVKFEDGGEMGYSMHRDMVLANQAALATLLKMVVVRSNLVVVKPDGLGSGDSNIWDMNGQLVACGTPFKECIVSHEFPKEIFIKEHFMIDRREVPLKLYQMIGDAAKEYLENAPYKPFI